MASVRRLAIVVLLALCGSRGAAEPGFHIYAPVKETKQLLVIAASPGADGLDLAVQQTHDLDCGPGAIAAHPAQPLLYVMGSGGRPHQVKSAVLALDDAGAVARATPFSAELGSVYAGIDPAGRFLVTADYGTGAVDVYPLDEAGLPGPRAESRAEGPKMAHSVGVSPDGRFVYVPHVKQHNALYQYALDRETGKLAPLDPADVGPAEGVGPRHVAFHPRLPVVYFTNEQQLGVSAYTRGADGRLTLLGVCDAADAGLEKVRRSASASDIVVAPDGKFVFTGLRGHGVPCDFVARFRVLDDGRLDLLGRTSADKLPWGFALSPDGGHLVVAATDGKSITAYRITAAGDLVKAGRLDCGQKVTHVVTR
jgi:6-phosphogluconolactonase (cycloisomerase 2 family)